MTLTKNRARERERKTKKTHQLNCILERKKNIFHSVVLKVMNEKKLKIISFYYCAH